MEDEHILRTATAVQPSSGAKGAAAETDPKHHAGNVLQVHGTVRGYLPDCQKGGTRNGGQGVSAELRLQSHLHQQGLHRHADGNFGSQQSQPNV